MRVRSIRKKLALTLGVWALLFGVGEFAARIYVSVRSQGTHKDGERDLFVSNTNKPAPLYRAHPYLAYESDPSHPEHNDQGFRGSRAHDPAHEGLRIACLGGSTTYSTKVAERDSYPRLLEAALTAGGLADVDVVNAGVSGYSSFNLIAQLSLRVAPLKPDACIFYVGWNDVWNRILYAGAQSDNANAQRAWQGDADRPLWRHSVLLDRIAARLGHPYPPSIHTICWHPRSGTPASNWGSSGFGPLRANIRSLVAICQAHGIRPVFCSQATDFAHHPIGLEGQVWVQAMDDTTAELTTLCRTLHVPLIDLRTPLSDQAEHFADCIHMTASGNRERARLIASWIMQQSWSAPDGGR